MSDFDDDREDPGPHTHIYVGTDLGDECEVCGRVDPHEGRTPWPHPNDEADHDAIDLGIVDLGEAGA